MNVTTEIKKMRDVEEVPTGTKQRTPSARVLEQVTRFALIQSQSAASEFETTAWLGM